MGIYLQARSFVNESQDQDSYDYKDINIIGTLMEAETEIKRVDQLVFESLLELDFVSVLEGEEENSTSNDNTSNSTAKKNKIIESFRTIWRKVKDAIIKAWDVFMEKVREMINSKTLKVLEDAHITIVMSDIKQIYVKNIYTNGLESEKHPYTSYTFYLKSLMSNIKSNINRFITYKDINYAEKEDLEWFINYIDEDENDYINKRIEKIKNKYTGILDYDVSFNVYLRLKSLCNYNQIVKEFNKYIKETKQYLNDILNEVSKSKNNEVASIRYKQGSRLLSYILNAESKVIQYTVDSIKIDRKIFFLFFIEAKKVIKNNKSNDNTTDTSTSESTDLTSSIIDLESDLYMESIFGF